MDSINREQIKQHLEQVKEDKNVTNRSAIIEILKSTLRYLSEIETSRKKIKEYQQAIDKFPELVYKLRTKENETKPEISIRQLEKLSKSSIDQSLRIENKNIIDLDNKLKKEQDEIQSIIDSLNSFPKQEKETRKILIKTEKQIQLFSKPTTPLLQAKITELYAKKHANQLKIEELKLAQLSANNRQELSRLRTDILKKRYDWKDQKVQILRQHLNSLQKKENEKKLIHSKLLIDQEEKLPEIISNQININNKLSKEITKQQEQISMIISNQRRSASEMLRVRQIISTIQEQSQWLDESPALGEILRMKISNLPEMPKQHQIESDMTKLRVQRIHFENILNKLPEVNKIRNSLSSRQMNILSMQISTQKSLLNSLLTGCDSQILELTKLKIINNQLGEAIKEAHESTHRYLFWIADVDPINFRFPVIVGNNLKLLFRISTISQLIGSIKFMFSNKEVLILIFISILLIGFILSTRKHYYLFLDKSSKKIGNINQDRFSLTLKNIFWSILISLPMPIIWATLGYGLRHAWLYPVSMAIGNGLSSTSPILWILVIISHFSKSNGLFVLHFGWSKKQVKRALKYYAFFIGMIVPLIAILISFDSYNNKKFSASLGRLFFLLLCLCLSLLTNNLKRAGLPLYLDKKDRKDNIINRILWNMMICAPILSAIASCLGYFSTSKALLARLETSVFIWFFLLIIYYIVRRLMILQRKRIDFDRSRQRRSEISSKINCDRFEEDPYCIQINEKHSDVEEQVLDLNTISIQSLRLVRSILTLIAFVSVILLWSELHSAFSFLGNIPLWEINDGVGAIDSFHPITVGELLFTILIFIITTQMVRNLPSLLELALLQHLDLSPGTGYAITTLTKYSLMLLGSLTGFSIIGIEWSKLQWLVAALGVGLGFGLQEIFANFISGLMILFEKPIRIGDTVTIRNLTGNITKINTRATTITDWDRKEIIVPNKAFITEQFVNWSLSDTVTRVVLIVPAPTDSNVEKITQILVKAALLCPLVLKRPVPEAFLVELQNGLPLFELRVYAAEMGHRMPLRHQVHILILKEYRENNIELPFPPFQIKGNQLKVFENQYKENQEINHFF